MNDHGVGEPLEMMAIVEHEEGVDVVEREGGWGPVPRF